MLKKVLALATVALTAVLVVAPSVRADIVDLLTFQAAVDAAQAVDPTLDPPPNDGQHDFAVGGFEDVFGEQVGLSAHSGPNGGNSFGHESVTKPKPEGEERIRSQVVCLAVSGKLAAWGTVVMNSNSSTFPPGTEFVEFGRDGGPGGAGDGWGFASDSAANCAAHVTDALAAAPITSGNILVHDEP
jgi:hypothetical protein